MDKLENSEIEFLIDAIGEAVCHACDYNNADWKQSNSKLMLDKIKAKLVIKDMQEEKTDNEINMLKLDIRGKKYKYTLFFTAMKNNATIVGNSEFYTDYHVEFLDIKQLSDYIKKEKGYESLIITGWKYMYSKLDIDKFEEMRK